MTRVVVSHVSVNISEDGLRSFLGMDVSPSPKYEIYDMEDIHQTGKIYFFFIISEWQLFLRITCFCDFFPIWFAFLISYRWVLVQ